ncbi:MAG: DUF3147 family protein [Candidatus Thermoplasmatota archaeon]|nr:DUF3147 family protein [Candidatus Thermoplasmatota archaeon]
MASHPDLTAKVVLCTVDTRVMSWGIDAAKIVLTALIIFGVVQVSEQNKLMAAVLASIPIVSVLAMIWMNHEGQSSEEIVVFAKNIVWLIIPSLLLFIVMPVLMERGWEFYPALGAGLASTLIGYFLMTQVMEKYGLVA